MESSRGVGDSFVLESPSPDLEISRGDYFREDSWTLGQIGEFSIRRLRGLTANTNKSAPVFCFEDGGLLKVLAGQSNPCGVIAEKDVVF